ncbi:MAG: Ig-like domain-containing protein [Dysosmobacter welbionis]
MTVSGGSGTYTWSSSDDGIASVDSTRVTAISSGQATLTVTDGSGKGTCLVRVRAAAPAHLRLPAAAAPRPAAR